MATFSPAETAIPMTKQEQQADQRQSSQRAGDAYLLHDDQGHDGAPHEDIAMGEVDQLDDAVDQGVSQRDQSIHRTKGNTILNLLQKEAGSTCTARVSICMPASFRESPRHGYGECMASDGEYSRSRPQ